MGIRPCGGGGWERIMTGADVAMGGFFRMIEIPGVYGISKIRGLGPHPNVRGTVNAQVSACAYACALRRILNVYRGVGDAYSYV